MMSDIIVSFLFFGTILYEDVKISEHWALARKSTLYIYIYIYMYAYIYIYVHIYTYIHSSCIMATYGAAHCNTAQHSATQRNTAQRTAIQRNTVQHSAALCSTLQYAATRAGSQDHPNHLLRELVAAATQSNTLQHKATHCNTLQHRSNTDATQMQHWCNTDATQMQHWPLHQGAHPQDHRNHHLRDLVAADPDVPLNIWWGACDMTRSYEYPLIQMCSCVNISWLVCVDVWTSLDC